MLGLCVSPVNPFPIPFPSVPEPDILNPLANDCSSLTYGSGIGARIPSITHSIVGPVIDNPDTYS